MSYQRPVGFEDILSVSRRCEASDAIVIWRCFGRAEYFLGTLPYVEIFAIDKKWRTRRLYYFIRTRTYEALKIIGPRELILHVSLMNPPKSQSPTDISGETFDDPKWVIEFN